MFSFPLFQPENLLYKDNTEDSPLKIGKTTKICSRLPEQVVITRLARGKHTGKLVDSCAVLDISADFGLSRIVSSDVQMRTVCGTPGYVGNKLSHRIIKARVVDVADQTCARLRKLLFTKHHIAMEGANRRTPQNDPSCMRNIAHCARRD